MKKHNIELSYKDLHAIKHALENNIANKKYVLKCYDESKVHIPEFENYRGDIEHETKLLERITEKINYIKDKYKIE